ncbi:TIGR01244 family sulfur transferase [Bartonella sp. DGB2]|uniref:TIGR01244 family sulfur transferase n=1 Tax=Bartonella sp. DGB2 TaxID=3388426 RepID=UPI00398FA538
MDLKNINSNIFIGDQIEVFDIEIIAKKGIKTIICNRPDGEEEGQPTFAQIQTAAVKHKIATHYIPITSPFIAPEAITQMRAILENTDSPLLAYCRSGARSSHLYRLATNS